MMSIRLVIVTCIFFLFCAIGIEAAPVDNITEAKFPDYKSMYTESPLCEKDEITLWTCETSKKLYSLCSSQIITKNTGYIQYRASKAGRVIFVFPASKMPPLGIFKYQSSGNGDASLIFSNGGYEYNIIDPSRGVSSIQVTSNGPQSKTTVISCKLPNQTLQLNYTMRLMYDSGIWQGY